MRKKEKNITFRLSSEEYDMIKKKAEAEALTVTQFIIKCCEERKTTVASNN